MELFKDRTMLSLRSESCGKPMSPETRPMHILFLLSTICILVNPTTSAFAASSCPKVSPASGVEIVSVRPLPGEKWMVRYVTRDKESTRPATKEVLLSQGSKLASFIGNLSWQSCDVEPRKAQVISGPKTKMDTLMDLISAAGPTDTQARPITSKPSTWGQKAAEAAEATKPLAYDSGRGEDLPASIVEKQLGSTAGVANVFIMAVQNVEPGDRLDKFGLVPRDLIIGVNNVAFNSETDASEKIGKLDTGFSDLLNIVRKGRFLNLTRKP
jgi:hypothetical protein